MNRAQQLRNQYPGAAVTSRHRHSIQLQTAPNKFLVESFIAPLHFGAGNDQEIDTAWVTGDNAPYRLKMDQADYIARAGLDNAINFDAGQIVKYYHRASGLGVSFQPSNLDWTNDLDQIQPIAVPQTVAATINDAVLRWNNAYGSGRHFEWVNDVVRLQKNLIIDSLASLPTPNSTILSGGNPVLRLQFIFRDDAGIDMYVDGVLWNRQANNPRTTSGDIEFRLNSNGQTLWYFRKPYVYDQSKNTRPDPLMRARRSGNSLIVEVRVPWSWLESAVYPIVIDPTVDEQIASDNGDGYEYDNTWDYDGYDADGLFLGYFIAPMLCDAGFVWEGVAVPNAATIDVAYVQIFAKWQANDTANTSIIQKGFAQDNPATFATDGSNRPSTRTKTTATVTQTLGTVTDEAWKQLNSCVSIIQEIVNRAGWASGNNLGMVLENNSATTQQAGQFQDYNRSATDAAKLHIEYTEAGGGTTAHKLTLLGVGG